MKRFLIATVVVVVSVLAISIMALGLLRALDRFALLVELFVESPLPWWILAPAALALIAGFAYLWRARWIRSDARRSSRRLPYN